ncbi:MAG TPA: hypothetical protein VFL62_05795 [Bradyrhizobium sp.]|uniref:hypothetical protein n=1 Tax=Bradyrhizobium sp. TaxID=376 RepID=UPI002D802D89|nr:hypothetical protein [Bradyrhizobium sp.]HET7885723.1 hypothetical protein [Bradyrhizobium sp.]
MLKLASKFAMDIFPSVIATILGAYIVNHYINNKTPAADPAAAVSTADPKKAATKADSKPAERSADLGNAPEHGVRAKGISEKSISDKAAADKATVEKPAEKADKPAETASIPPTTPADTRRHAPTREKAASKPAPAAEPVVAAPVSAPAAEPAATPDANDLARAAIERLRGGEPVSRTTERTKAAEPKSMEPKPVEPAPVVAMPVAPAPAPVVVAPPLQPLPPPIMVSTPQFDNKPVTARANDPLHPTPPADIPDPGGAGAPLDLRADATDQQPPPKRPNVAEDVLSATKKLFNSVIPK